MESTVNFNTKLKEAASFGQPITEYDPGSRGYKDFANLARELMGARPVEIEPIHSEKLSRPAELVQRAKQLSQLTNLQFGRGGTGMPFTAADTSLAIPVANSPGGPDSSLLSTALGSPSPAGSFTGAIDRATASGIHDRRAHRINRGRRRNRAFADRSVAEDHRPENRGVLRRQAVRRGRDLLRAVSKPPPRSSSPVTSTTGCPNPTP